MSSFPGAEAVHGEYHGVLVHHPLAGTQAAPDLALSRAAGTLGRQASLEH